MLTTNFLNELANQIKAAAIVSQILALIAQVKEGEDFDKSGEIATKPKGQQFGKYRVFTDATGHVNIVYVTGRGKALALQCEFQGGNLTVKNVAMGNGATGGGSVVYPTITEICAQNSLSLGTVAEADIVAMLTSETEAPAEVPVDEEVIEAKAPVDEEVIVTEAPAEVVAKAPVAEAPVAEDKGGADLV